jgi:hypothetical protein
MARWTRAAWHVIKDASQKQRDPHISCYAKEGKCHVRPHLKSLIDQVVRQRENGGRGGAAAAAASLSKASDKAKIALDGTREVGEAANKAIQLTARNDPRKSQVIPSAMRRPMAGPPVSTRRSHGRSGMRAAVRCLRLRDAFMVRDRRGQSRGDAGVADVES